MLNKIKIWALLKLYNYHRKAGMYYFEKIDAYGSEKNEKWFNKVREHFDKECNILNKLLEIEGI